MIGTEFDLLLREGAMLLLLAALGSFPASLAPGSLPPAARIAIAPAFGLALGLGLLVSASQVLPMATAAWAVLVPLTLLSLAAAGWRARTAPRSPLPRPGLPLAALAITVVVPLAFFNGPLVAERTAGPAGYFVADASGYSTLNQALAEHTWNDRDFGSQLSSKATLGSRGLHGVIHAPVFQTGTGPLGAALNSLFGWRPSDAQTALMIVLVLIGAAGCFAFLLTSTGSPLAAAIAGLLFAGPVSYQLFIDASQAALAALALFGALALIGSRLRQAPLLAGALFGALAAGVATAYPAWLPVLLAGLAICLLASLRGEGRAWRRSLRPLLAALASVAVLLVVVSPVAVARDIRYAHEVSTGVLDRNYGEANVGGPLRTLQFGKPARTLTENEQLPRWDLPAAGVPAWLTGGRDLYFLPSPARAGIAHWLVLDLAFPLLVIGLAVFGAVRFAATRILLGAAAVFLLAGLYSFGPGDCSYCGQRSLLPLAAIIAMLAGAGVAGLVERVRRRNASRMTAVLLAGLTAILVLVPMQRDTVLARRLTGGGFLLGRDARSVLGPAAAARGPVMVEGLSSGVPHVAGIQSALLLSALVERLRQAPVIDRHSLSSSAYFPDDVPSDRDVDPSYRWVFTSLGGVATPRRTVARAGPYALQRRSDGLDATIDSGVTTDLPQRDPSGDAWVQGPVTVTVAGRHPGPAGVLLALTGPAAAKLRPLAGARLLGHRGGAAIVCLPVRGGGPIRRATLRLRFRQPPPAGPADAYGNVAPPGETLRVAALRALPARCSAVS